MKDTASPTQLEVLMFQHGEERDSSLYLANVIYMCLKCLVSRTSGSSGKALAAAGAAVSFPFVKLKVASPVELSSEANLTRYPV